MFNALITQFWPSTIDGLTLGAIYALLALGYTMVYGVLRLINFAHAEIFMIGTFGAVLMINIFGFSGPFTGIALVGVLFVVAAGAVAVSGASAVVLEFVAYRRLRKKGASRLAFLISALGASLFLQELFALEVIPRVFDAPGRVPVSLDTPLMEKTVLFSIGNGDVRADKLLVFIGAIVMMVVLDQLVNRTRMGRGIRATAQNPESAVLMGVNIDRVVTVTFLIGGVMAGLAATLYMVQFGTTLFFVGFLLGIKAFTAAVMGGIGNLRGALVGGLSLGLIEQYGTSMLGSEWQHVIAFTILVLVLMFRPTGILGESLQQARA